MPSPSVATNINNRQYALDAMWNWEPFNACFGGTKIRISDLDGIVERRGEFLVLEGKQCFAHIPTGQQRMFDALVEKGFTVLILYGAPLMKLGLADIVTHMQVWPNPMQEAKLRDAVAFVREWFDRANQKGRAE